MTRDQLADLVGKLGDIIAVLRDADPADRTELYQRLGLRLTYHPGEQKVASRHSLARTHMGKWLVSEAEHEPFMPADLGSGRLTGVAASERRWMAQGGVPPGARHRTAPA